jgi:hypothetical protein
MGGFTSARDLGTEGAGYADVGLRDAIKQGIIPGPRMWVATRAIVVTGEYAPKGFAAQYADAIPQGAEEADGPDGVTRVVRDQIKHGADWVKLYADYRWARASRRVRRFPRKKWRRRSKLRIPPDARSPRMRSAQKGCVARQWRASIRSNTATTARLKSSN